MVYLLKMVIFYSYVKLPDGIPMVVMMFYKTYPKIQDEYKKDQMCAAA